MHPTSVRPPRGPDRTRSGYRRRRTSQTSRFLLAGLGCLAALGGLAGLLIAKLPRPPSRPAALSWPTAHPAGTSRPAAGSATSGQPKLGAFSWPAGGTSAAYISGYGVTDGPGATRRVPIASVAKLMTAYVILRDHPLSANGSGPGITVQPSEAAEYPSQLADGDSLVRVAAGETLTERQALAALLLPSADNIAWILARWDAGGRDAFAAKMNAAARGLGMSRTSYTDPSGLDSSTVSTAADQVRLGAAAMRVPALAAISAMPRAFVPVAGVVRNTNTWQQAGGRSTLVVAATFGQPGSAQTILPNALRAGHDLVLAVDTALDTALGAAGRSRSRDNRDNRDNREGSPQGPPLTRAPGTQQ